MQQSLFLLGTINVNERFLMTARKAETKEKT